jgi:small subunit ribosomal protein S18e
MAEGKCAIKLVEEGSFIHVLRIFNANIKGVMKVGFALSIVKGIGLRLAHVLLKVARIDPTKRAGELTPDEVNRLNEIVADPKGNNRFHIY